MYNTPDNIPIFLVIIAAKVMIGLKCAPLTIIHGHPNSFRTNLLGANIWKQANWANTWPKVDRNISPVESELAVHPTNVYFMIHRPIIEFLINTYQRRPNKFRN